jgi:cytoskeletal protein RodZ
VLRLNREGVVTVGENLGQARDRTGLTLAQVSERTRIRQTIIRDIERDDFSSCGGDFYARGHIRAIAKTVGIDPRPLIEEFDEAHSWNSGMDLLEPKPAADIPRHKEQAEDPPATFTAKTEKSAPNKAPDDQTSARLGVRPLPTGVAVALMLALVIVLGFAASRIFASPSGQDKKTAAPPGPSAKGQPSAAKTTPATPRASNTAGQARVLSPATVVAFGPSGIGQGDNPQLAGQALAGNSSRGWHTSWYTTAQFGNLQNGTGLLLDMGRQVTITSARVTLGPVPGANLELRVGNVPTLAGLSPVASATGAGGALIIRPAEPASGRYVLIWLTKLPPDNAGTFEAWISDIDLRGVA